MPSPAERDEFLEYFSPSGAITCRVLYRSEQLAFVQFRTVDWPGYKDFGNYARVALFPEHLRPADPQSPGVMSFVAALMSEAAAQQQHLSDSRHQANGQSTVLTGPIESVKTVRIKSTEKLTAAQGNGVKPPPKSAPARGLRVRTHEAELKLSPTSGKDGHLLKPVRSIAGLTLADFLCDR